MVNYYFSSFAPDFSRAVHIDTPLHLLGGLSIAYSASYALRLIEARGLIVIKNLFIRAFIVVGAVAIAAVLWEFYEFLSDHFFGTLTQPSKADTMKDLFMGMLGGLLFCLNFIGQKKKYAGIIILLLIAGASVTYEAKAVDSELRYDQIYSFVDDASAAESTGPAAEIPEVYYRAKVLKILEEGKKDIDGTAQEYQKLELEIVNGPEKGKHIFIDHGGSFIIGTYQKVTKGEVVVIANPPATPGAPENFYYIIDKYRANGLIIAAIIFLALAIYFGRKRGLTSIIGLIFSVLVIFYYIIPSIAHGNNPLVTCIIGAIAIILVSLYLSHGFNRRTTIALLSTLICLGLAIIIDLLFVHLAKLTGTGTEEAFFLQFDNTSINLRGLFLGGILLGVLGVLDDVTTSQVATIEEISAANPALTFEKLYQSGLSVGREHIASLINTLVLAYVGVSFPLLLLYSTQKSQQVWVMLNSNFIAEEIVRTLVGSSVLVIAVPLTTILAAFFYSRKKKIEQV